MKNVVNNCKHRKKIGKKGWQGGSVVPLAVVGPRHIQIHCFEKSLFI
jgi:hypothetical protein